MTHDPLCDVSEWGPDNRCIALTFKAQHDFDYPVCNSCWDKEDNCYCQCDLIALVRTDERRRYTDGLDRIIHQHGTGENP